MGRDVQSIGRHSLDVSSIESLAKDLAIGFKANVEFGVLDTFDFDWDGFHREPSFEYLVFGKVEYLNSEKTLLLTDEYYLYNIVYGKYGEDAYKLPYFSEEDSRKLDLEVTINNVRFELRDKTDGDTYGIIINDAFYNYYNYFNSRWWSFCRAFTEEDANGLILSLVNEYRHEVMDFFEKIGGKETFYFDDQGKTQYLTENYYSWQVILGEVEKYFKDTTLYIPGFMVQKNVLPIGNYPLAFYDDFADLIKQRTNQQE